MTKTNKKLKFTIEVVVDDIEDLNTNDMLDVLRENGKAEIIDIEIIE